jgi:hypothetical protein
LDVCAVYNSEAVKHGDMWHSDPEQFQQMMETAMRSYNGSYARMRRKGLIADITQQSPEMMLIFESVPQGGGGQFLVGRECMRRMKDPLLVNMMSRDEQHLAEQFILGQERSGASRLGVPATGGSALGVKKTGGKAKGVAATGGSALGVKKTGGAARGVKKTGGAARGVEKGPRLTPPRCNICSWFERRKVIKDKGHKCSEAAKEALAGLENKMTKMQLVRAVEKMLREAKKVEEEDEYEPPAEGEASSSKGVLKRK